jgi:hypothetical protein
MCCCSAVRKLRPCHYSQENEKHSYSPQCLVLDRGNMLFVSRHPCLYGVSCFVYSFFNCSFSLIHYSSFFCPFSLLTVLLTSAELHQNSECRNHRHHIEFSIFPLSCTRIRPRNLLVIRSLSMTRIHSFIYSVRR